MPALPDIDPRVLLTPAGLMLGATHLASFSNTSAALAPDPGRLETLFAVAFGRPPSGCDLSAMETAATHWRGGDKALANLRLVFADLPQLQTLEDAVRLKAAELLLDAGLHANDLAHGLEAELSAADLGKYDPDQARVPAGSGPTSGQWTKLWERFRAWLDAEVPVYDTDTGIEVGTQSRARSIVTNPLAVGVVGTAVLLGGEAALPAAAAAEPGAAIAPALDDAETLSPFAQRYLSTSGGRLGSTSTRQQLYEIAEEHQSTGQYVKLRGDGHGPEEFLRDPSTGKGTYVDFTAEASDGSAVRIQTIDTLADGITPNARELSAASRIRRLKPNDELRLVPKR